MHTPNRTKPLSQEEDRHRTLRTLAIASLIVQLVIIGLSSCAIWLIHWQLASPIIPPGTATRVSQPFQYTLNIVLPLLGVSLPFYFRKKYLIVAILGGIAVIARLIIDLASVVEGIAAEKRADRGKNP